MSRIGKKPIEISEGVDVKVLGKVIKVKGPKGSLDFEYHRDVEVNIADSKITVTANEQSKQTKALWGLTRMLIANMIEGVTKGFEKQLELHGVGFRMAVQGKKLNMALGFSHPVEIAIPDEIEAGVEKNILTVSGIDKQKVGQFAAFVRSLKEGRAIQG